MPMRVLVDIDETLNNLVPTLLNKYNDKYTDNIKLSDIVDYRIHKFLKPECENLFKEFVDDETILGLSVKPYAVEALTEISKYADIYFVTAGHPATAKARDKWLQKHFPFYTGNQLVLCRDKYIINADIMIDDNTENILKSPCSHKFLFDMPWNTVQNLYKNGITLPNDVVRCYDWEHILREFRWIRG